MASTLNPAAEAKPQTTTTTLAEGQKVHGVMAEYTDVDSLLAACRRVRDAGFTKADAFTPFPVHGIDEALGIKPTVLPWIALACGATGTTIALLMQISMNGDWIKDFSYPYIISGKPFVSLPAFIPVTFELTILLASFGAFFGMWILNGLPKFSNPMFTNPRFDRATDDTFFLFLDAKDARFSEAGARKLLGELGGQFIEPVVEDASPKTIPRGLLVGLAATIALSFIPALVVARMRVTKSSLPRFHVFYDMDFSPAKGAQVISTLFADGRAMRADVPGTVSRGALQWDLDYQTGIDMEKLTQIDAPRATRLVAMLEGEEPSESGEESESAAENGSTEENESTDGEEPMDDAPVDSAAAATPAAAVDNTPWLNKNPLPITAAVLERGQQQFGIYCSVCHGMNGRGNGLVNQRAQSILATTWTPPSNIHDDTLYSDAYPEGKLFNTITHGIRKMSGYAGQITVADRWAIVAYVRALQASQNASLDEIPEAQRKAIQAEQAEIQAKLDAAAAAEKAAAEKSASST